MERKIKQCSMCNEIKDVSDFNKNKASKTGLTSYCKECFKKVYEKEKEDTLQSSSKFDISLYLKFMKNKTIKSIK